MGSRSDLVHWDHTGTGKFTFFPQAKLWHLSGRSWTHGHTSQHADPSLLQFDLLLVGRVLVGPNVSHVRRMAVAFETLSPVNCPQICSLTQLSSVNGSSVLVVCSLLPLCLRPDGRVYSP